MTLIQWAVAEDPKINMGPMVAKMDHLQDHPMQKIMILMIPLVARVQGMIQMIQTLVARVQGMIQMEEKILMTFLDVAEENPPMIPAMSIVAKDHPQDLVMTSLEDLEKILKMITLQVQIEKTAKIQDIVKEAIELQEIDMVKNVVHPVMMIQI
jgi:hypothetical protein